MINILLYDHSKDFYRHNFQGICSAQDSFVVSPNPSSADFLREVFTKNDSLLLSDSITVAKLIKDQMAELFQRDELVKFKGKSDLLVFLSTVYKQIKTDSQPSLAEFNTSFRLLTDLRSFSMSEQVMETALEEYGEDQSKIVLIFQKILEEQEIIDEHKAYYTISERLRQGDLPIGYSENNNFIFWGFDFLSALQVDFIKALSIRNNIIIPLPKSVYESLHNFDWPKWLEDHSTNIIEIPSTDIAVKAKFYKYPSLYLSKSLRALSEKKEVEDIYLATKKIDFNKAQEVSLGNINYKVKSSMFKSELNDWYRLIESELFNESSAIELAVVEKFCHEQIQKNIESENFLDLKVYTQFLEVLDRWKNLSVVNENFSLFDLVIFKEILDLDLPRISLVSVSSNAKGKVNSLAEISKIQESLHSVLCISKDYESIKSSGTAYVENVEKYLGSIGPLKRGELEFLFTKQRILEALSFENVSVLIEDGIVVHDLGWSEILGNYQDDFDSFQFNDEKVKYTTLPCYKKNLETISATKLQTYIDCPKKYHYKYNLKWKKDILYQEQMTNLQLGRLEHLIIEKYLTENDFFDEGIFEKLVECELENLCQLEKLSLTKEKEKSYQIELISLCGMAIKSLCELRDEKKLTYVFEKEFLVNDKVSFSGSIDLFAYNSTESFVIDFKRSSGSIPSKQSFLDLEKIQIWFYLEKLERMKSISSNVLTVGYINLSSLEDSLLVSSDTETSKEYKKLGYPFFKKVFSENIQEILNNYKDQEKEWLEKIESDSDFLPLPAKIATCSYCELSQVCSRGIK